MARYYGTDIESLDTDPDLNGDDSSPHNANGGANHGGPDARKSHVGKEGKSKPDLGFVGIFQRRSSRLPSISIPKATGGSPVAASQIDTFNMQLIRSASIKPKGK